MAGRKKGNQPGDVVLVHLDGVPAGHARIEDVRGHARPGWYECDLLFLAQPPQPATWILEREQIDGTPFTMGGRPVRIEALPPLGELHAKRPSAAPAPGEPEEGPGSADGATEAPPRPAGKPGTTRGDKVVPLVRKKP